MDERELPLRRGDLDPDPVRQFAAWLEQARAAGIELAEACALATAAADGRPSARMVLLKEVDDRGFVFASSYASRKGHELAANPRATLIFYWHPLGRQVRVEGAVERTSAAESDAIFGARPRASRISALASHQSRAGPRVELEQRVHALEVELEGRQVERPAFWGGYRLVPDELELWQHRADRLHLRFRYRRCGDAWELDELDP